MAVARIAAQGRGVPRMSRSQVATKILILALVALMALLSACGRAIGTAPAEQRTATQVPTPRMPPKQSWIVIDLPPGASQLAYGAEVYRLVCSACHGDRGQGLTAEWRATWAPADQNCWQSKCHASNHPPDGFVMPIAPAVVGAAAMARFTTAQDLYDFVQRNMPWQDPGSLAIKDSWAVSAHIFKMNGIDPGPQLGAETAGRINVHTGSLPPEPASTQAPTHDPQNPDVTGWIFGAVVLIMLAIVIAIWASRNRTPDSHME